VLAYKLDAEHFAAAPDHFASLAYKCMRYCGKSKPVSDLDTDLSNELRTVQRHIQNLTLVADEVIVEREPRSVLRALRGSRFCFVVSISLVNVKSSPHETVKTRSERQRYLYHFHSA